uniref:Uncharacterized protein n=1 Tax=viral metagenome TaxID=1070528 RepID=A0A6C0LRZ4_9ZZZZ
MLRPLFKRFFHSTKNMVYTPNMVNPLVECESNHNQNPVFEEKNKKPLPIDVQYYEKDNKVSITIYTKPRE